MIDCLVLNSSSRLVVSCLLPDEFTLLTTLAKSMSYDVSIGVCRVRPKSLYVLFPVQHIFHAVYSKL